MEMAEEPAAIGEVAFQLFQLQGHRAFVSQVGYHPHTALDFPASGGRVGHHVVYLPSGPVQGVPGVLPFRFGRDFFRPPGDPFSPHPTVHAHGSAHGEEGMAFQGEQLPTHQVVQVGQKLVGMSAFPCYHRVLIEQGKVLMVPVHKGHRIGPPGDFLQHFPVRALGRVRPGYPEIPTNKQYVLRLAVHAPENQIFRPDSVKIQRAVDVSCEINHDGFPFIGSKSPSKAHFRGVLTGFLFNGTTDSYFVLSLVRRASGAS